MSQEPHVTTLDPQGSSPSLLGLDPGAGAIKLYGSADGAAAIQLPSVVAVDGSHTVARMAGLAQRKPPLRIRTADGSFYVGATAHDWGRPVENLDHDRFAGSPEMRALVLGALTQYFQRNGSPVGPLAVTVGLPLQALTGADQEAAGAGAAVRRWLVGTHTWEANDQPQQATITAVQVTSQPAGALFDFLLDEQGAFVPERKALFPREIGIVSVGMNTVELLVVRNGAPVQRFTEGQTAGVRRLLELVSPGGAYSRGELDAQLRAGRLDCSSALPVWGREVMGYIERRWGTAYRRFASVIVVGGGALLLQETLWARFAGKAYVSDDPVMATARGLYKLARSQGQRRSARPTEGA
jgi:hypothetical protein